MTLIPRARIAALLALAVLGALTSEALAARAAPRRARRPVRARPAPRPRLPPAVITPASGSVRDLEISEAARRGLGLTPGAVVAMDPYTGRVISLVNPGEAMMTAYQPCSVFKIVVAVAGLSEGVLTPDTVHHCRGGCWMWPGHGPIDLRRALAQSCNPFFEAVGERLGYDAVHRYSHLLGLGSRTGINLTGESAGWLPAFVSPGDVGHLSSHAKGITTSALQIAVLLSATVNGGIVFQPQIAGPHGFVPRERWRLPVGTVLGGLSDGFLAAVNEGSAVGAFDPDLIVAGKTGTCAGVGWFASYAPADRPEVVIVAFTRPGNGHSASAVGGRVYRNLRTPPAAISSAGGAGPR